MKTPATYTKPEISLIQIAVEDIMEDSNLLEPEDQLLGLDN